MLGCSHAHRLAHPEQSLTTEQNIHYQSLFSRHANGEPLAYLLGHWEFWSLDLLVDPAVLIPRPETELLVELALAQIPRKESWSIADLGTGSGAIALAVARERPNTQIIATDHSSAALAIAKKNAHRLGVTNVQFVLGDWFVPLAGKRFHLILSNPPYVAEGDQHLENLRFEPSLALIAGSDGLSAICSIVSAARFHLSPGGRLLLEHGHDQGEAVRLLLRAANYQVVTTICDLEGRERVTGASKSRSAVIDEDGITEHSGQIT